MPVHSLFPDQCLIQEDHRISGNLPGPADYLEDDNSFGF